MKLNKLRETLQKEPEEPTPVVERLERVCQGCGVPASYNDLVGYEYTSRLSGSSLSRKYLVHAHCIGFLTERMQEIEIRSKKLFVCPACKDLVKEKDVIQINGIFLHKECVRWT